MEVYYYIDANKAEITLDCGLKLSENYSRVINIDGVEKRYISTLLNPKDDMEKYKSAEYKCLKFELPTNICIVADSYLYIIGESSQEAMRLYVESIKPVNNYAFGTFRLPECLVSSTILPEQISMLDKRLDSPVIYDNSEDLYINNIIEINKEQHDDFQGILLYCFYLKLVESNKVKMIEDKENRIAVFIDNEDGKTVTLRIPRIS